MSRFTTTVDLIPQGILLLGALVCCGVAALRRTASLRLFMALGSFTLVAAGLTELVYLRGMPTDGYHAFGDGLVVDRYSVFVTATLCAFSLIALLSSDSIATAVRPHPGEYTALLLLATLGGVLLGSAREMISFYIALELLSVSLYVLVPIIKTQPKGSEAAFKYLVLGAASSAVLLYGLAILYGVSGQTDLVAVGKSITHTTAASALGVSLVLVGLTFKLGAVPFQQWVPDVYEGAPAPVAGLIAAMSETAGFAIVARVAVTAFGAEASNWTALIAIVAVSSMVLGNLVALVQTNVRRLLAWSGIAQSGYVLMGVLAYHLDQQGVSAMLFYLFTYGVTITGMFAVVGHLQSRGVPATLDAYRGLSRRSPGAAVTLALGMVSLIGVPPLVGFFAKLLVFQAAVLAGYAWLMLVALVMTVVSAGYYLRVVKVAFVDPPAEDAEPVAAPPTPLRAVIALSGLAVVALGAAVQPLYALATGGGGQIH